MPTTSYGTMLMHHLLNRPQMPWSRRDFATVLQLAQNRHTTGLFVFHSWIWQSDCTELEPRFATHCCKYFEEEHDALPLACPVTASIHSFSPVWLKHRLLSWRFSFQFPLNYVHFRCLLLYAFPCPLCFSHLLRDLACKCLHLWRALLKYRLPLQDGMHVLEQRLLHQTKLFITRSKPPWYYECLWLVLHHQTKSLIIIWV